MWKRNGKGGNYDGCAHENASRVERSQNDEAFNRICQLVPCIENDMYDRA